MKNACAWLLAGACVMSGAALSTGWAANPGLVRTAVPKVAAAASKPRELGGKMPLPVAQRIERQNSPEDKLVVEVTNSAPVGGSYVAYVKVAWGDLDNMIKKDGKQYYSPWNGNLKLSVPAVGAIDEKIQFDDGVGKASTKPTTVVAKPKAPASSGPHAGSGRDEVEVAAGADVTWEAAVVGALDGLRIKITSSSPVMDGTLVAGKFTVAIHIVGGTGGVTPAVGGNGSTLRVK